MTLLLGWASATQAADVGYRDFMYKDINAVQTATEDKPQSKLWFQDGQWWGLMYSPVRHSTDIYRLDLASQRWSDTGTVVDTRPTARADVLWDGQHLYVLSGTTVVSEFSSPPDPNDVSAGSADLSRFSYDPLSQSYTRDPGFPVTVHQGSTEDITLAKDSTGMLWVTYALVAPDNSSKVYVNHSTGSDTSWGTPFVLPTAAASVHYDDISTVIAFQGDKVGVMWSNQLTRKFYLAVHNDGAPDTAWNTEVAYGGGVGGCNTGCANDHVNVKQLSSDGSGRLFAAVKTANRNPGQAFVSLLVRDRDGVWSSRPFGAVEDLHTRPMVVLDEEHREVFMFAVSPEVGGTIYYKKSGIDNISFPPGVGTPFMQSSLDSDISNPTTTKQSVNTASGLLVVGDANTHGFYWHNWMSLAGEPAPPPAAPTDPAVSAAPTNADSSLRLTWSDNSANETGFAIERRTATGAYGEIARVPADTTTYTDTGLTAGDTFTYRLRAFNGVGNSLYSEEVSATTAQTGPVRTFVATEDAYVDSGAPNSRFGTKSPLSVDASPVQEAYLKFQLSGLAGNTVVSAKLRLYVSDNGSVKGGSAAMMSNTSWAEPTVTYNTRPAIDGATLSSLGAVAIGSWYDLDVTSAVRGDGTLGLGLKTASTDGVHYASREDPAHAPQLVVTVTPGDTVPPQTTIGSGPSGTVTSAAATFAFTADESGSTFECKLDDDAFMSCTSPQQYAGLADGPHVLDVRATDIAGNTDPTPARRTWTIDTVPPATLVTPDVGAVSNHSSASFSFVADETGASFKCSLDGSAFAACTSPKSYTGLGDGEHTFTARATDAAGNIEVNPSTVTWTIDTAAPTTSIDAGPQGAATSDTATFTFSSNESGSTFECSLDASAYEACTSPRQYTGLADGAHTFTVRATDAAGNVDASPPSRAWTIDTTTTDTTPPGVSVSAPADGSTVGGRVIVGADAVDDVAVDHVDFLVNGTVVATDGTAPYSAAWDSTTVSDGPVTLTARAVDTTGNAATSDGRTVTIDNTPPATSIDAGPQGATNNQTASFGFSSDDARAGFGCSLDGSAYSACTSPQSYAALADGSHTFAVRAVDGAGNADATPATRTWTVDTVAPDTTLTSGPSGTVNSRSAILAFASTEAGSTFECSLDGSIYAACASPKQYSGLADGAHTFRARAKDGAGNTDPTPVSLTWTVDPLVFSDGFETGDFSRWTQPAPHVAIDGTGAVQTGTVRSGTYAATLTAPSSTSYAYLRKTFSAGQADVTISGDFRVTAEGAAGQEVPFFKLYDSGSVRLVYVNRRNISGRIYVVSAPSTTPMPSSATLALGTWAHVAVHVVSAGSGASTVEAFLNGTSIYRTTTAGLGTAGVRTIQIGNDKQLPFSLYADNIDARL